MSSLLDVLHKRPHRSRLAVSDTQAAAMPLPAPAGDALAAELQLEAETRQLAQPEFSPDESAAAEAEDGTTAMRRWLDRHAQGPMPGQARHQPESQPESQAETRSEVLANTPQAAPGPAAPVRRPDTSQKTLLAGLVVAAGLFAAFLVYQFAVPTQDSFVAIPAGELPAPAPTNELPVADVPAEEPAAVRKPVSGAEAVTPKPAAVDAELAWYDQPALPAAPESAAPVIRISRGEIEDPMFGKLRTAYAALQTGAAARAEALYREVLAGDPNNIDALLGLATLASQGARFTEAGELYRQVQRVDPKNSTAAAALSALPGAASRAGSESQLKTMLREQPGSASLHFALGLRYITEQRWPDAQVAFFEALRYDPTNADYAFNLAVSLDRLGQPGPAASYYQRALDLVSGSQQFDPATARTRLATLRASPN